MMANQGAEVIKARQPRFYGTKPAVLPEKLPPGTSVRMGSSMGGAVFPDGAVIRDGSVFGRRTFLGETYGDDRWNVCGVDHIDWATVPIEDSAIRFQSVHGSQPDVLPKTLPSGTRTNSGAVASCELVLDVSRWGRPAYHLAAARNPWAWVHQIDWASVPIPEPMVGSARIGRLVADQISVIMSRVADVAERTKDAATASHRCPSFAHITAEIVETCSLEVGHSGQHEDESGHCKWDDELTEHAKQKCGECSSPATIDGHCAYCAHAFGSRYSRSLNDLHTSTKMLGHGQDARMRMAVADRRRIPRVTADARELAKPHPWHADESEP